MADLEKAKDCNAMTPAMERHDDLTYRQYVKKFFLFVTPGFLVPAGALMIFFYVVDPLQLYHKSWFHEGKIIPTQHEQMAGIINTHDFDSIILGTSMLQNSSAIEAERELGGKFVNLSIAGSNLVDRRLMLDRAMHRPLRHVILSLEPWYYLESTQDNLGYQRSYWGFLYDNNPFNDMKIYFSHKYLGHPTQDGLFVEYDRDAPFAWKNNRATLPFFESLKQWKPNTDSPHIDRSVNVMLPGALAAWSPGKERDKALPDPQKLREAKKYIDENVLDAARKYPGTRFSLLMPPFSRFYYSDLWHRDPASFLIHQEITRHLAREASTLENVEVYGFEDASFVDDMGNYLDHCHYFSPINSLMTKSIASGEGRLTPQNVEAYLERCRQKADTWDLPAFHREVERIVGTRPGAASAAGATD